MTLRELAMLPPTVSTQRGERQWPPPATGACERSVIAIGLAQIGARAPTSRQSTRSTAPSWAPNCADSEAGKLVERLQAATMSSAEFTHRLGEPSAQVENLLRSGSP